MIRVLSADDLTEEIYNDLKNYILSEIRKFNTSIALDNYEIDLTLISNMITDFLRDDFSCYFYANNNWYGSGKYITVDGVKYAIATKIYVYYSKSQDLLNNDLDIINQKIDEIINPLKFTRSNIDKILYINDYFIKKQYTVGSGDIYKILTDKVGTIANYTRLCKEIFDRLEIQNKYTKITTNADNVTGEWLVTESNGEWYHFGIGFVRANNVLTKHFELNTYNLKSDNYISNLIGYDTTTIQFNAPFEINIICGNNKYDWLVNVGDENE